MEYIDINTRIWTSLVGRLTTNVGNFDRFSNYLAYAAVTGGGYVSNGTHATVYEV